METEEANEAPLFAKFDPSRLFAGKRDFEISWNFHRRTVHSSNGTIHTAKILSVPFGILYLWRKF